MSSKARILVVDDNRSLVRVIERTLQKAGYEVLTAFDGLEGVQKAREEKPDLIILDIIMPNVDGYKACRYLDKDPNTASIPVLFLSIKGDESKKETVFWRGGRLPVGTMDRIKGFEAGAIDFLTKPVKAEELLDRVEALLSFGDSLT